MDKKYLLFFIILFNPVLTFANDCGGNIRYFNSNFKIVWASDKAVTVKGSNSPKNIRLRLDIGKEFNGIQDRHGSIIYKLISISKRDAKFEFSSSFDSRGIGGKLTECKGKFSVNFKSNSR